jgi:hypothetical protein
MLCNTTPLIIICIYLIARAHDFSALSQLPDFSGILRNRMTFVVGQTAKLGDLKNAHINYFSQKVANF